MSLRDIAERLVRGSVQEAEASPQQLDTGMMDRNGWKFEKYVDPESNAIQCWTNEGMPGAKVLVDFTKAAPYQLFMNGESFRPNLTVASAEDLVLGLKELLNKPQKISTYEPEDPDAHIKHSSGPDSHKAGFHPPVTKFAPPDEK